MSTDLANRTAASVGTDLDAHHAVWTGASAKARAARAARDHDHDALWSLCQAYLAERDHTSRNTVTGYRYGVRMFTTWAADTGAALLRPERGTGSRYRHHLMGRYPNPSTVNGRLSAARCLYRALDWVGLEVLDPFAHVAAVRDGRSADAVRPAYSVGDLSRLLGAATDPHDRVLLLLGANAGLRAAEMLALDWSEVELPERTPEGDWASAGRMLVHGKGRTLMHVPIGDELADALSDLPARSGAVLAHVRSPSGLRYRVARLAREAGLIAHARDQQGVTLGLHRLRHRYGTDVVQAYGLAVGQAALRHANPATTSRYVKDRENAVAEFARGLRRP